MRAGTNTDAVIKKKANQVTQTLTPGGDPTENYRSGLQGKEEVLSSYDGFDRRGRREIV
jgi:hypothetical protein